jgi:hypothetical protein
VIASIGTVKTVRGEVDFDLPNGETHKMEYVAVIDLDSGRERVDCEQPDGVDDETWDIVHENADETALLDAHEQIAAEGGASVSTDDDSEEDGDEQPASYNVWIEIEAVDEDGDAIVGDCHEPHKAANVRTLEEAENIRDALLEDDEAHKDLLAVWDALAVAAENVVRAWEGGDLAAAVRELAAARKAYNGREFPSVGPNG